MGRAIRGARERREELGLAGTDPSAGSPTVIYAFRRPPRRQPRWREIAALGIALSIAIAFLIGRQSALPSGEAGSASAAAAPQLAAPIAPFAQVSQLSRGKTAPGVGPVVVVVEPVPSAPPAATAEPAGTAEPASSPAPAPVAAPAPGPQGTGAPGGSAGPGAGTGVGTGTGDGSGGSPAASLAPTPRPAAYVPLELPVTPLGYYRIGARITDPTTRQPLADVCVIVGTGTCGPDKPRTNEVGVWYMDVPRSPSATQWDIRFVRAGYIEISRRVVTSGEDVWLELGLRRSR